MFLFFFLHVYLVLTSYYCSFFSFLCYIVHKMPRKNHPFSSLVLFTILSSFSAFCVCVGGDDNNDKRALLEFKSAITEDPLGFLSNWNPKDENFCSWNGVYCDPVTHRVTALHLSSNVNSSCFKDPFVKEGNFSLSTITCLEFGAGFMAEDIGLVSSSSPRARNELKGTISPALGLLSELSVLSLSFNGFHGELPSELGELHNLKVLDLGFNALQGTMPLSLGNCTALEVFCLSGNRFNGTFPSFLAMLPNLKAVLLSVNMLTGDIPSELGENCGDLEYIHLSNNLLSGAIPSSLGNCSKLRSLVLSSNIFQDGIPSAIGKLGMLEVLDLSRNFLSGVIPPELSSCKQLKLLVLKNSFGPLFSRTDPSNLEEGVDDDFNFFGGLLPDDIVKLPYMRMLWAPGLNLEGNFPQSWESCSHLEMLNLAGNYFTGQIPSDIGNCKSLLFLDLSSNNLTGMLPGNIAVPCMAVFNVSRNLLSGNLPDFVYDRCNRKFVNLTMPPVDLLGIYASFFYRSSLSGIITPAINASGAIILHDFSQNMFTGPIPPWPIDLDGFSMRPSYGIWLDRNNLDGNFSTYSFSVCLNLDGLFFNVGNNKITGELPMDMGSKCSCMKSLSVEVNELMGMIPQSFANLNALVNLNLSTNKLHGPIPSYISQMMNLKGLSLSANNFTGEIPGELAELANLEVLELSSNALLGEIPPGFAKLVHLNVLRLDHNNLSGQIPIGFKNLTSLSVFDVSFNNLSGAVPLNSTLVKCENVQGNPNLQPCPNPSFSEWEQQHSGNTTQQVAEPPSGSIGRNGVFTPIEIASITSASIIVSVLISLLLLFFCMKRSGCNSVLGQGLERKEVITCNDIGVQLTYENVVRATGGFNVQNCIGSGGFGATYKAEIVPDVLVAVKRLSVGRFQGVQQFSAEIKTLGRVKHPNLVTLIGYHVSESEMFLIYNYLPGGNLEKFIHERPRGTVEWSMLHKIALDIARALAYLHDECVPRVLHRDIKPSNILLDNNFNAYLSDFGLARLLGTSETHATTDVAGTFGYVAPEYAMTCRVSDKADVYSYGVVLLELISDKKALDPSFSSYGNGFNIVAYATMLLRQGQASDFFTAGLWESGPHDHLIEVLHLAVMCTGESLSARPSMRQVAQRLKRIEPSGG